MTGNWTRRRRFRQRSRRRSRRRLVWRQRWVSSASAPTHRRQTSGRDSNTCAVSWSLTKHLMTSRQLLNNCHHVSHTCTCTCLQIQCWLFFFCTTYCLTEKYVWDWSKASALAANAFHQNVLHTISFRLDGLPNQRYYQPCAGERRHVHHTATEPRVVCAFAIICYRKHSITKWRACCNWRQRKHQWSAPCWRHFAVHGCCTAATRIRDVTRSETTRRFPRNHGR